MASKLPKGVGKLAAPPPLAAVVCVVPSGNVIPPELEDTSNTNESLAPLTFNF